MDKAAFRKHLIRQIDVSLEDVDEDEERSFAEFWLQIQEAVEAASEDDDFEDESDAGDDD